MTSVLITGGTGFFGKSILDYFSRHACPYEFTLLSRKGLKFDGLRLFDCLISDKDGKSNNLKSQIKQFLGDVRTFDLPTGTHFDYVIHAATPARADIPDDEMRSIILDGTANAIKQAKKCGATKFMMVSSGGVYGKGFTRPISEDDAPHPFTAYGQSKLQAEQMAIDSGLYTLIPRCFAFVGKHLDRNAHFAIGNFIRDALAGKDIVINGDGTPMRSYMYADDLVEWLFAILERGTHARPYNVGSPDAISIKDLAQTVLDTVEESKSKVEVEQRTDSTVRLGLPTSTSVRVLGRAVPGAANYYVPVVDRAMKELGLELKFDLSASIKAAVRDSEISRMLTTMLRKYGSLEQKN